jgi:transcriptional regulator with GAF, ATPase, and Fis domain
LVGVWRRISGYNLSGERSHLDMGPGIGRVFETGRPARIDSYEGVPGAGAARTRAGGLRSSVTAPIVVEGRLWGVMGVASMSDELLPPDTEARLTQFSELMATAVANAQSHAELAASRARIVATADATRQRIERDLHDGA